MRFTIILILLTAIQAQSLHSKFEAALLQSSHVMTGYVLSVQTAEDMTRASNTDVIYRVKLVLHDLEKGTGYSPGNFLTFSYVVDSTTSEPMAERTIVRVYMVKNKFNQLALLNAKSWEAICK